MPVEIAFSAAFDAATDAVSNDDKLPADHVRALLKEIDRQGAALANAHRWHRGDYPHCPVHGAVEFVPAPASTEDLEDSTVAHEYDNLIAEAIANGNARQAQFLKGERSKFVNRVFI